MKQFHEFFFFSLCVDIKSEETSEDLAKEIMNEYDMSPYDDKMISEEEFVYDCLNNATLYNLLQNSLKTYIPEHQSSSEDEDGNENINDILMGNDRVNGKKK